LQRIDHAHAWRIDRIPLPEHEIIALGLRRGNSEAAKPGRNRLAGKVPAERPDFLYVAVIFPGLAKETLIESKSGLDGRICEIDEPFGVDRVAGQGPWPWQILMISAIAVPWLSER
jgi:hypothetical protein